MDFTIEISKQRHVNLSTSVCRYICEYTEGFSSFLTNICFSFMVICAGFLNPRSHE